MMFEGHRDVAGYLGWRLEVVQWLEGGRTGGRSSRSATTKTGPWRVEEEEREWLDVL